MKIVKKIGFGIIVLFACIAWVQLKADTIHREFKMISNLFSSG